MDVVLQQYLKILIYKENKWNNQMTHGMCWCVCCMCSVMREGMCEKSK